LWTAASTAASTAPFRLYAPNGRTPTRWWVRTYFASSMRFEFISPPAPNPPEARGEFDWVEELFYTCWGTPVDRTHTLQEHRSVYGVLLGTGDVLKFQSQPSAAAGDWVVQVDTGFNTKSELDADVYAVRSDQPASLDFGAPIRSQTIGGPGESFVVRNLPAGATFSVAVHSRRGSGTFKLRAAQVRRVIPALRAGFSFATSQSDIDAAVTALTTAQRQWLAMSGGSLLFERFELTPRKSSTFFGTCDCQFGPCDVCFHNVPGRAFAAFGRVEMFRMGTGWDNNYTLAHELGHHPLGALDEYQDHRSGFLGTFLCHSDLQCGHSIMGSFDKKICKSANHTLGAWPRLHSGSSGFVEALCDSRSVTPQTSHAPLWRFFGLGAEPTSDVEVPAGRISQSFSFLQVVQLPSLP
jgi:hypothetical protein